MTRQGEAYQITIAAEKVLEDVHLGDSIAVNGICLTVTHFNAASFTVDAVPETVRRSNLSSLKNGSLVNLERAMAANGRFGGHIVAGHVDSTATILSRERESNAVVFRFRLEQKDSIRYILPKGSITVDGISLTVVDVGDDTFSVSIIPHTLPSTNLAGKHVGDTVNLECDLVGKYIERFLLFRKGGASSSSRITEHFLTENGFI